MYSSQCTLQSELIIDGKVISSGEMVFEGTYFFPININSYYHVLQKYPNNRTISLSKMINGNFNTIYYD